MQPINTIIVVINSVPRDLFHDLATLMTSISIVNQQESCGFPKISSRSDRHVYRHPSRRLTIDDDTQRRKLRSIIFDKGPPGARREFLRHVRLPLPHGSIFCRPLPFAKLIVISLPTARLLTADENARTVSGTNCIKRLSSSSTSVSVGDVATVATNFRTRYVISDVSGLRRYGGRDPLSRPLTTLFITNVVLTTAIPMRLACDAPKRHGSHAAVESQSRCSRVAVVTTA